MFGRPVGTLSVDVAPSGDGLWTVASRDWRAGEDLDANAGAASDSWQLRGSGTKASVAIDSSTTGCRV